MQGVNNMHKINLKPPILFALLLTTLFGCESSSKVDSPPWHVLWERKYNEGPKSGDRLNILINKSKEYLFCTSIGNFVEAINLNDGSTRWDTTFRGDGHRLFDEPLLANSNIYFGNGTGNYFSFDQDSFNLQFQIISKPEGPNKICRSPQSGAISNNIIVIGGGAHGYKGWIQALHAYSGEILWDILLPECTIEGKPAYDSERAYFLAGDSLIAIDYNGNIIWKYFKKNILITRHSFPVLYKNRIYLSTVMHLCCLNVNDAKEVWSKELSIRPICSPLVIDDKVFIHNEKNIFFCFDAETGKRIWKTKLPKGGLSEAQPVKMGDYIALIIYEDHEKFIIYWLNEADGKIKYRKVLPEDEFFNEKLVVSNSILYLQSKKTLESNKAYNYSILRAIKVF